MEDYSTAARLRDLLTRKRADNAVGVEEANAAFYAAFQQRNIKAMEGIWGLGDHVQCIHPSSCCISGRESVIESWKVVLANTAFTIQLQDILVHAQDDFAVVTCLEVVDAAESKGRIAATNIFEKQDGRWRIIHHHGSLAPPLR
ncbi:hypothetical protein WJX72_012415 [[Myrmecia] bisecta]|uniref:SnoaL-like domain-containing protein n=1 Tax=[Myrmecia] bisecta TaxID=41462 RepID=A0AAW1PDU5_9CHLO